MSSGLSFGGALTHLKHGARVTRAGWNGAGMWLILVHPTLGSSLGARGTDPPSSMAGAFVDSLWLQGQTLSAADWQGPPRLLPWIGLKTANDGFVPWVASQTDLLAEDWEVVS